MKLLLFLITMFGCTTIKPTVSNDLFVACTALCKKKQTLESVTTNIELNYYGRMKLISNTCTCKNNEMIELVAPGESIF